MSASFVSRITLLAFTIVALSSSVAAAARFHVLYSFPPSDGSYLPRPLFQDAQGNLFGTTLQGGYGDSGTVFKRAPHGKFTTLHYFNDDGYDGYNPSAGVIMDSAGNLYGTTLYGGDYSCEGGGGCGAVFKISPDDTETVLYGFQGGTDGNFPTSSLIFGTNGDLYGTTQEGGNDDNCPSGGCGTVFRVSPEGKEKVIYRFLGGTDGAGPGSIVRGRRNHFYGTTSGGGAHDLGTVFEVNAAGAERVLYSFAGGADAQTPGGNLVMDSAGNLYGMTSYGSELNQCGAVFKVGPHGTESILHDFAGGSDGCAPRGLAIGSNGVLYGTTSEGGDENCDCGVVFQLSADGEETILHTFAGPEASSPGAPVILGADGELYGTTTAGGANSTGTIFRLRP